MMNNPGAPTASLGTARAAAHLLMGVCSQCGARHARPRARWNDARVRNTWLMCASCGGHLYPVKRTCAKCGTVLRNGNFTKRCAPCTGDSEI